MNTDRRHQSERGAVLLLGLVVIILGLLIGALIIDIPLSERSGRMLQRTADAAVLAGATQLRPLDLDGENSRRAWYRAKRAIFASLKLNSIYGDRGVLEATLFDGTIIGSGVIDEYEAENDALYGAGENPYKFSDYTFGPTSPIVITVQRGLYYRPIAGGDRRFQSLEGALTCLNAGVATEDCDLYNPIIGSSDPPVYRIANAVQMTMRLQHLVPIFARLQELAFGEFGPIERIGMAGPEVP